MTAETTAPGPLVDPENPAAGFSAPGFSGKAIFVIAVTFSLWQIYTAAYAPFSSIVIRSVHVGFLMLTTFTLVRARKAETGKVPIPWYDWCLGGLAFLLGLYHWGFETELIQRSGEPSRLDLAVGVAVILLLLEAARRLMGWGLPIFCAIFIPYALFGRSLPPPLLNRGFGFDQVIDTLYLGTDGIYGTPTFVSATYIFLFILFGAFLEKAGMIRLFNDIALGTVGHTQGGPAKVAVISSGLMGTINGSGIANVLTIGQFTIPLMRRFGYRPAFAGAVEATSSMGGQIMPPVMGAVAFIMAETLNVPYATIAISATIPAVLYYASAFWMVHLEAGRNDLVGLPKDQCPSALGALRRDWYLALPLGVLVYMLFTGYTPLFAGWVGLALTMVLILGKALVSPLGAALLRGGFWVALGLVGGALVASGALALETTLFLAIAALALLCLVAPDRGGTVRILVDALAEGAKSALGVGIACALVGIIVGIATLTGLAGELARIVLDFAGNSLFLALLMTMVMALILGTGLPTIPTYIVCSAMAAPALLQFGVPLILSHMFVFYFGIMADLTPPVALAALAASSITKTSYVEIGFLATRVALAGYVIPYMWIYDPSLMLQGNWSWISVGYIVFKALFAIMLWGGAATGYLFARMSWLERLVATAAAFLIVAAVPWTDEAGFALGAGLLLFNAWRSRAALAAAP
ncbi:MAG TPA: TRAP transporter permease [Stellaceae bacterium]|jgi:TRAP transporter 4TM/12TM fusion protein